MAGDADCVIIFESHATSLDNEAGLASGWFDVDLSPTGEKQARALGARRRADRLAAVFCSDLTRAFRTAEIAFGDRPLPIVRDLRLRECDYGTLTRHPASEIEGLRAAHVTTPFQNGESYQQVVGRVATWLSEVATAFRDRTVLAVGHRATFYALQHLVTQIPLDEAIASPWRWQPGWTYHTSRVPPFDPSATHRSSNRSSRA
jgi:broad specificity phosphatase PhoE